MRRMFSVLAVLALATCVVAAQATKTTTTTTTTQTKTTTKATPKSAKGTIDTFANNVLTVKTATGSENFSVTANTKITKAAKPVDSTALAAGDAVKVTYTEAAGTKTATNVTISAAVKPPVTTPKKK
jgi:hypothetical protein